MNYKPEQLARWNISTENCDYWINYLEESMKNDPREDLYLAYLRLKEEYYVWRNVNN